MVVKRQSVVFCVFVQNMADIKKLKSVGICTVKGIQMTTRKALCNIKGLSEAKVEKIKEAAGKMLVRRHSVVLLCRNGQERNSESFWFS